MDNDEGDYNCNSINKQGEKLLEGYKKLNQRFAEYGLVLSFCGHLPSIGVCSANGAFTEKINRYFYE